MVRLVANRQPLEATARPRQERSGAGQARVKNVTTAALSCRWNAWRSKSGASRHTLGARCANTAHFAFVACSATTDHGRPAPALESDRIGPIPHVKLTRRGVHPAGCRTGLCQSGQNSTTGTAARRIAPSGDEMRRPHGAFFSTAMVAPSASIKTRCELLRQESLFRLAWLGMYVSCVLRLRSAATASNANPGPLHRVARRR